MSLFAKLGGIAYALDGPVTAAPIEHGLTLETITLGDGTTETFYSAVSGLPKSIVVLVHAFSSDETEITADPAKSALLSIPDAVIACPRLFGPAGGVNTCGAPAQLAHLNAVIAALKARFAGASPKVYLTGVSGGAGLGPTFMGAYPGVVQGASFWCGYNDLAQWYAESVTAGHVYSSLMASAIGGPPSSLAATYLAQSPAGVSSAIRDCTMYINDGILDTEIPHHHRTDLRDALLALPSTANVNCQYIGYPVMGHAVDWPTAVSQINAMIGAVV